MIIDSDPNTNPGFKNETTALDLDHEDLNNPEPLPEQDDLGVEFTEEQNDDLVPEDNDEELSTEESMEETNYDSSTDPGDNGIDGFESDVSETTDSHDSDSYDV